MGKFDYAKGILQGERDALMWRIEHAGQVDHQDDLEPFLQEISSAIAVLELAEKITPKDADDLRGGAEYGEMPRDAFDKVIALIEAIPEEE